MLFSYHEQIWHKYVFFHIDLLNGLMVFHLNLIMHPLLV